MTDFDRILHSMEPVKAQALAHLAAHAASETATRRRQIAHARKRFAAVGVAAYLQEQAAAMLAQGFHAKVYTDAIDDRVHVSMEFVPRRGEAYIDDFSADANGCQLVILGFANGNDRCGRGCAHTGASASVV